MRAAFRSFLAAALLISPAVAEAGPIIPNGLAWEWSVAPVPTKDGQPFWDNQSDDCGGGNCAAYDAILSAQRDPFNLADGVLEYLHDTTGGAVAFAFTSVTGWISVNSATKCKDGFPDHDPNTLAITYTINAVCDDGINPNFFADSLNNPEQFALFRQVGNDGIRYFFAFEDKKGQDSDYDYNDLIMSLRVTRTAPEPATLALLGTGILGLAARRLRRRS